MGAAESGGLQTWGLLLLAAEVHPCTLFGPRSILRLACVLDKHMHAHTEDTNIHIQLYQKSYIM